MKNKLLKTFSVALVSGVMLCSYASAKTVIYTTAEDNGSVILNIKSDDEAAVYAAVVTLPGQSIDTIEDTAPWKVVPITTEGEKGTVSHTSYDLGTATESGSYTVYVSGGEMTENAVTKFAVGADSGVKNTALAALNGAVSSENLASVLESYNNAVWYVDEGELSKASVKNAFAGVKKELYSNGFEGSNDVEKCFRTASALAEFAALPEGGLKNCFIWHMDTLGLDLDSGLLNDIISGNAALEKAFYDLKNDSKLNPVTQIGELKTLLERSRALEKLNTATRENIEEIWTTYGAVLGLKTESGDYVNPYFKDVNTYELIKLVERNENRPSFTSLKEIKDAYDSAITALINEGVGSTGKPGGAGGSGGGGSAGGGGVSIGGGLMLTNPELLTETKAQEGVSLIFNDLLVSHWACRQIEYAAKAGIMQGDGDGNCRPDAKITRAEFIQMIANSFELMRPATGTPSIDFLENNDTKKAPEGKRFTDVPEDAWFYEAVDMGYKAGVINGYEDGSFGADDNITRQDAAAILMRAKEACSLAISSFVDFTEFTDMASVAEYASESVKQLQKYGVVNGYEDGSFKPMSEITRAEALKMIYTVLQLSDSL